MIIVLLDKKIYIYLNKRKKFILKGLKNRGEEKNSYVQNILINQ